MILFTESKGTRLERPEWGGGREEEEKGNGGREGRREKKEKGKVIMGVWEIHNQ